VSVAELSAIVTTDNDRALLAILEEFTGPKIINVFSDRQSCRVFNPLAQKQYLSSGKAVAVKKPKTSPEPVVKKGQDSQMTLYLLEEKEIPVNEVVSYQEGQTRQAANEGFDKEYLLRLGESLLKEGQFESIVVRLTPDGRYELIAGECRTRASRLVGKTHLRAKILKVETPDDVAFTIMLMENINKAPLTSVEKALACERAKRVYGWSIEQIANKTGLSPASIYHTMPLASLSKDVRDFIIANASWFSVTAALQIATLPIPKQLEIAQQWMELKRLRRNSPNKKTNSKIKSPLDLVGGNTQVLDKRGRVLTLSAAQKKRATKTLRTQITITLDVLKALGRNDLRALMDSNYSSFDVFRRELGELAAVAAKLRKQASEID